jgi:hypothetical protein
MVIVVEIDVIDMKKLFVNFFCNRRPLHHPGSPFEHQVKMGKSENRFFFSSSIYKKVSTFRVTPENSAGRRKNTASIAGLRIKTSIFLLKL